MNKTIFITAAAVAVASMSASASAMSNKPMNAATADKGVGCLVSDIGGGNLGDYLPDASCTFHTVTKNDRDGNPVSFKYQDKGQLQPGQVAPDRTITLSYVSGSCDIREVITPSGRYSSTAHCTF